MLPVETTDPDGREVSEGGAGFKMLEREEGMVKWLKVERDAIRRWMLGNIDME